MATSAERIKDKNDKRKPLQRGRRISVADLRVGHKIVTKWHKGEVRTMTLDEAIDAFETFLTEEEIGSYVSKFKVVQSIAPCEGQWRTHIHVNKNDCYDTRSFVWIVAE